MMPFDINGKYNTAKVFAKFIDDTSYAQILQLCNQEAFKDSTIRIMPDVHAGKGCVVGFTSTVQDKVIPNIVGVDIGCGMLTVNLGKVSIDLERFDHIVRSVVPSGMEVHSSPTGKSFSLNGLLCYEHLTNVQRIHSSIGTLGGGNHFIELEKDSQDNIYLVIHTGSRNLGKQVAEHYQQLAIDMYAGKVDYKSLRDKLINDYKSSGKQKDLGMALKEFDNKYKSIKEPVHKELCYLQDIEMKMYLNDMEIAQLYAYVNRHSIASNIMDAYGIGPDIFCFTTTHNYIDMKSDPHIIRKGSISAKLGERVLIPLNMRDGSILAIGKGNADWNYSAPHGAGRLYSRGQAKELISLYDFQESMKGIYSTCVSQSTIDESPMAYKPMEDIIEYIGDTVEVIDILKPIYNFKAGDK